MLAQKEHEGDTRYARHLGWHQFVPANMLDQCQETPAELLVYLLGHINPLYLAAIGKVECYLSVAVSHTIHLNQLIDLCRNGFPFRRLIPFPVQLTVARSLLCQCLLSTQFVFVQRPGLLAFMLPALFTLLLLDLFGLLFIYQPSLFQLVKQRVTHFDSMWGEVNGMYPPARYSPIILCFWQQN